MSRNNASMKLNLPQAFARIFESLNVLGVCDPFIFKNKFPQNEQENRSQNFVC